MTPQDLIDQWRLHPDPEVGSCANQLAGWLRTQEPSTLRQTLELDGHPVATPIRVAGFLRHYAGMIRRNERWDVPETMANTYESAALQLEKYHAALLALVAIWRERKHAGEFSIVDGEADLTKCADELDAMLAASRGGGDTRPPREEEKQP
jgi:hypothetical protein